MVSAYPIIAVDIHQNRLNLAKSLGANYLINSSEENPFNSINKILGRENIDVFIDNTGNSEIIEKGYKNINNQGRVVLVGVPKLNDNISIFSLEMHFGKRLIGSHGGECNPEKDIPRYLKLIDSGALNLKPIISKEYSLNEINNAIYCMKEGKASGRIIINLL